MPKLFFCTIFFSLILLTSAELDEAGQDENSSPCGESRDKGTNDCGESGGRRFYFDAITRRCQPFLYEGCGGNGNRFDQLAQCKAKCANFVPKTTGDGEEGGHSSMVLPVPKCEGGVRAAVDEEARVIQCPAEKCPVGYKCQDKNCCPANKDIVCNVEYDTGRYAFQGSHTPRYFYKKSVENCLLFTYYGALGNANNFETYNDCIKYCKNSKKD